MAIHIPPWMIPIAGVDTVKAAYLEDGEGDSDDVRDSLRYLDSIFHDESPVTDNNVAFLGPGAAIDVSKAA